MVRTLLLLTLALGLFRSAVAHARESDPAPDPRQMRNLSEDPARQARFLLKLDYSRLLEDALAKRPEGFRGLFRFTTSEAFVGAGAESHCIILRDLLRYFGDRYFSRVLRDETSEVRTAVIHALDYTWPHPGWRATEYSATYRLAKHQKIQSSPP
jgi:hypothetical protein